MGGLFWRYVHDFNPRSREGSDIGGKASIKIIEISIHAPAKGATPAAPASHHNNTISIHAPAKGATFKPSKHVINPGISIHAPAKGATFQIFQLPINHLFQSTLPRRERRAWPQFWQCLAYDFNPRSREGSDPCLISPIRLPMNFNPRSREGSDLNQ